MPRRMEQTDLVAVPSNAREVADSPEQSQTTSATFVEMKAITISFPGAYRFKYVARREGDTSKSWTVELRRNGTRVGQVHDTSTSNNFIVYIEDKGGWKTGDSAAVYGKIDDGETLTVANFVILGEYSYRFPAITPGKITKAS
jgi:hypothetical protein